MLHRHGQPLADDCVRLPSDSVVRSGVFAELEMSGFGWLRSRLLGRPPSLAQLVNAQVPGDRRDPGPKRRIWTELFDALEGANERVLR